MCNNDKKQETASEQQNQAALEEADVQALKRDMDSLRASMIRLQADFDNYRKRVDGERVLWFKYAVEPILPELLDVADDLERALDAGCGEAQDGLCAIHRKLLAALERQGVTTFESMGEAFDPHYHDAVAVVHEEVPRETVKEVLLKGYNIRDKVARHARVVVASPPERQEGVGSERTCEDEKDYRIDVKNKKNEEE